jgi:hypothetical protein
MRWRWADRAHFDQAHMKTAIGKLPRSFAARQATANNGDTLVGYGLWHGDFPSFISTRTA